MKQFSCLIFFLCLKKILITYYNGSAEDERSCLLVCLCIKWKKKNKLWNKINKLTNLFVQTNFQSILNLPSVSGFFEYIFLFLIE